MKKILLYLTLAVFLFQAAACGQTPSETTPPTEPAATVAPVETAVAATPDPTETPAQPEASETDITPAVALPEPSDAFADITLLDAQAMGIITEGYSGTTLAISTREANALLDALYTCFDAIGVGYTAAAYLENDPVMGELTAWVFQILAGVALPSNAAPNGDADVFLRETGIVYTDVTQESDKPATVDDAMLTLARAAAYAAYANDAGSNGLVWEVSSEDTTVYLLGSLHVDDAMIYPFSRQLSDIIKTSDAVVLEVDFGDAEGVNYLQTNSVYGDGDGLSKHISEGMMAELATIYAQFGITDPAVLEPYRPWVLASEILSLSLYAEDGQMKASPMVIDLFVYYKALESSIAVWQAESYQLQTDLLNAMDDAVQEAYLQSSIDMYNGVVVEDETTKDMLQTLINAWRTRDVESFVATYDKDSQEDALSLALFADRDVRMFEYVLNLLQEKQGQYLVTFGAGHMIGVSGIVERLREEGFNVRLLPAA